MLKAAAPRRVSPDPRPQGPARGFKPTARRIAGGAGLVVLAALFWIIFYQNLPAHPLNGSDPGAGDGSSGNTVDRVVKIGMILISLVVIAARLSSAKQVLKNLNAGLIGFMLLVPLSAAWSIDRNATLLRYVTMAGIVLVCFSIALCGWSRRRLQQVTLPPVMYILVASLVLGAMYPDRIIEIGDDLSQKDAWHGITHSKNLFGMMSSVGAVLCVNLWLARAKGSMLAIAGTAISFACLLLSRSNTSLFATLLACMFMFAVMRVPVIRDRFSPHVAIGFAAVLIITEMLIQRVIPGISVILAPITGLTGKDATFSARTIIWDIIKDHIRASPLLGTGYGAYWTGATPDSPSYVFVYRMYFYPTESHNGYLDIMNDLGILGLGVLLLFIVAYVRQALQLMKFDRAQASIYLALLYLQLVMNMSESDWISRSSTFAILMLATTTMARSLVAHRAAAGRR
jgi:O-antigen ligase